MESISERLSEATLLLILGITFFAHKLRWRDSSYTLALVPCLLPAIVGKGLIYWGPEPKVPLFLFLYCAVAATLLVWGLCERQAERING